MLPSRETRHELYDFLQKIGLKFDSSHKARIRDFLLKHSDQKITELSEQISHLERAIRNNNAQLTAYNKRFGSINYKKELPPQKTEEIKPRISYAQRAEGAEFKKEEVSSFTMPVSVKHKK